MLIWILPSTIRPDPTCGHLDFNWERTPAAALNKQLLAAIEQPCMPFFLHFTVQTLRLTLKNASEQIHAGIKHIDAQTRDSTSYNRTIPDPIRLNIMWFRPNPAPKSGLCYADPVNVKLVDFPFNEEKNVLIQKYLLSNLPMKIFTSSA